jgi:Peptidase family M28/PA domain
MHSNTRQHLTALFMGLILVSQACAQSVSSIDARLQPEVANALMNVNPDSIRSVMSVLASDRLEGRQPGTRGFALASSYVESHFKTMGLTPGVNGKSYVQPVLLKKAVTIEQGSSFTLGEGASAETLVYGKDFMPHPYFYSAVSSVKAPLIFVGYGIYAPELKYDDYSTTDVKGCIVVYFDQAPAIFPSNERAYFSSATTKYAEAVKRGAVGVITISSSVLASATPPPAAAAAAPPAPLAAPAAPPPAPSAPPPAPPAPAAAAWAAMTKRAGLGTYRWAGPDGQPQPDFPELKVITALNPARAQSLFAGSEHGWQSIIDKAKAGEPQSFPLKTTAALKVTTTLTDVHSSNLIGVIPGSDPVLKNQYVVYAAHLDHFGIGAPVKGDSIYNGAHDNASGVAILLEIARTFRSLPKAPKRSVIIAIVTGEEYGLLGSDYFITHPTVPRKAIVANLALDMPFFFHPVLDIVPYGALHSSLSAQVEAAAGYLGLGIAPDPFPEQVVFIRSDHYSFIRQGIPSLFIKSGFKTVQGDTTDRSRSDVAWRSTTYHTPQDDMTQAFNFDAAATHVKLNFLIGLLVCEAPTRPSWNNGDFFGGRFARQ